MASDVKLKPNETVTIFGQEGVLDLRLAEITLKQGESVVVRAENYGGKPVGGESGSAEQPSSSGGGTPGTVKGNELHYAVPWTWQTEYLRTQGFKGDMTLVIGFMIPADAPIGQKGRASGAEDASQGHGPNQRDACISTVPGSFDNPILSTNQNPSPLFWLNVGTEVQPGITYYMNIKNSSPTTAMTEMSCQVTITN